MSSKKVNALDFTKAISDILLQYGDEATEACRKAVPEVAKETVKELRATSPKGNRGKYAKSWTQKTVQGRNGAESVVYSNKEYRLTHLLEKGHALRAGGRTKAQPHIAPAEEKAKASLISKIEKGLGK